MGYRETINCPHCHENIDLEVDIEGSGDDAFAVINPILRRLQPEPHDRLMDDKATEEITPVLVPHSTDFGLNLPPE